MRKDLMKKATKAGVGLLSAGWLATSLTGFSQEVLDWDSAKYFQYNIHAATAVPNALGRYDVTVLFSVTNPQDGSAWDVKNAPEFRNGRVAVGVGWSTEDYQNTGSSGENVLQPLPFKDPATGRLLGNGAALPMSRNVTSAAVTPDPGRYSVNFSLPAQAVKTGVAIIEGRTVWRHVDANGVVSWIRVPVKSAYRYFPITVATAAPRREVVDINKCQVCHDGGVHGDVAVPRLSLHGGNRTEELQVCAVCHNPNQTDIPYRTAGAEVSIDFKGMIHSIHAGEFRENPFRVTGFQGTVVDFSEVRFPAHLRDCALCHVDTGTRGTYELPLEKTVLGSTVNTRSTPGSLIDVNPANDLRISPQAAVCSSCHDRREAIEHMVRKGGRFSVTQADITSGKVKETCVNCHGRGREKDVRRVHEAGRSSGVER